MLDASGNPNAFTVMLYNNGAYPFGVSPGSNLGTLDGSLNPATAGIYTYTPASSLTLSPGTVYFVVLTAGTAVSDGGYKWSLAGTSFYNPNGGWFSLASVWTSSNGSSWPRPTFGYLQYAINATPIPEPGVFGLLALLSLGFLWHRWAMFLRGRRFGRGGVTLKASPPAHWWLLLSEARWSRSGSGRFPAAYPVCRAD